MGKTCSANGRRQTTTLNCEISTIRETKLTTTVQKTLRLLMGLKLVMKPKNPESYMTVMMMRRRMMMMSSLNYS